jgi:hypothetical protein
MGFEPSNPTLAALRWTFEKFGELNKEKMSQWLIAQLVEHSLSVMKDLFQISARTFVRFAIDLRSN